MAVPTSVVYFVEGYTADAPAVAGAVGIDVSAVQAWPATAPLFDIQDAKVVVILGADYTPTG